MALDLGNLTASIVIDTASATAKLNELDRKLAGTEKALGGLDNKKVDVTPAGGRELDRAGASASGLSRELDKAGASAKKVTVNPSVPGALDKASTSASKLAGELTAAEKAAADLGRATQNVGASKLEGALGGLAAQAKNLAPQLGALATAGTVLTKGWDRLTSIDNATFKLQGLGHESQAVATIMDSALSSVKGTAFGLGDAATAAANAVASGIKPGAELTQVLTTMSDTAAISGASLNDMGMIFSSVMAKGKLQGDDLLQLMGRGVPVLQMIGDHLGITAQEVSALATEGKISFEIFEAAMRDGVGGAAQEMGQSIEGSLQNAGAAIGRLGEAILGPVTAEGPAAIAGLTSGIDLMTDAVNAAFGAWEAVPGPVKAVIGALVAAKVAQMALNSSMAEGLKLKVVEGFTPAASAIGDFASALGEAHSNMKAANPGMGDLSAGFQVLAGSGGVASTAMDGLKGAAGGLLSALGGPWGLAIGGATVAVGLFMQHVQQSKQAQEEHEAATQKWADTLAGAEGAITGAVQEQALAEAESSKLIDTFHELGFSTADVAAAMIDLDGGYQATRDSLTALVKAGTRQGADGMPAFTEAAQDAMDLRDELDRLHGVYAEGEAAAQGNAEATNELALKVAELYREGANAQGGLDPLIGIFEAMNAEAKSVDEAIENLAMAMLGLSDDPAVRLQTYLGKAAESMRNLNKELAGGNGGFDEATGMFDVMTEQGFKLHNSVESTKNQMYLASAAAYELAQAQGATGVEAAEAAAEAANGFTDSLEAQLEAAGWTQSEIDALLDRYGLIPGDIMTHIAVDGVDGANSLLDGIDARMARIDSERHTLTIDADSLSLTQEQVEEMGFTWQDIGNNVIQLTADGEQARNALGELATQTKDLGTGENTIVLRGDHKDVVDKLNQVKGMSAELKTNPAELPVVADTMEARRGLEELGMVAEDMPDGNLYVHSNSPEEMQKLLDLGAQTVALPEGFIAISDTSAENIAALEALGLKVTTLPGGQVVITENSQQVKDKIDQTLTQKVLNKVGSVTLNVVENIRSVFRSSEGRRIPEFAGGGAVQKLATGGTTHGGYRLPLSGPGTERTDGILGIDSRGIPTSWVDRGEFVTNRAATAKWLNTLIAINADDPYEVVNSLLGELPMLANGGILSAAEIKSSMADMDNGAYLMGGFSTRQTDCSGGVAAVVNTALGLPRFESRMSTVTQGAWLAQKGFLQGRGDSDDIVVGWYDYGGGANGHTSMRLQDGTFIESGGNTGQGFTIGGKAGSLDGRGYTHFMHLPYDSEDDGFLTGDEGAVTSMGTTISRNATPRAEWQGIDTVGDSVSGIGSTFGRGFTSPTLPSPAATVAGSGVGAMLNAPQSLVSNRTWENTLGGPVAGQIMSVAQQLEQAIGQGGISAQVDAALKSNAPNWDVWLRVSPETIEAFNNLGQAQVDRENAALDVADAERDLAEALEQLAGVSSEAAEVSTSAARKVEDAEESLARAREDGDPGKVADAEKALARAREDAAADLEKAQGKASDEQAKAMDNVAAAEAKLTQERAKEQKAIEDLRRANNDYTIAMAVAPINALMELTSGIVAGTQALAEAFWRLDEVIQSTNAVLVRHEEAQINNTQARLNAMRAEQNIVRQERTQRGQRHADILAVQQAEWDLAMARHSASKTAGAAEVDLSEVRQQGIWNVFQVATAADQAAIMSASNVALMEANLQMVRAEQAVREQQAAYDSQIAMIELEYAQRDAELQAQYLAIATAELAMVQAEGAGIAGYGASALAKQAEGTAQKQQGIFGLLGNVLQGVMGVVLAPATGGASLLLTGQAIAGALGNVANIAAGSAIEEAYAGQAQEEFDALPEDIQQMIVAQQAGIPLAAAAGALMGAAGGSSDDVALVQKSVQSAFSVGLDIAISKAQAALQAAEAQRQREEREAAVQERKNRLDELNARLEADRTNFEEGDSLAELLEIARQQYQEMLQENKQLAELNKTLAPKNQAVVMSLGGSGWGDGSGGASLVDAAGGFGGLTASMVDAFSSLGFEDGWSDGGERARQWAPWLPSEEEWLASGPVLGLPDSVVGVSAQVQGAAAAASQGSASGSAVEGDRVAATVAAVLRDVLPVLTAQDSVQIGTQFTGEVTVHAASEQAITQALAEHLARA